MSEYNTTLWLDAAYQHFQEAVYQGMYPLAKDIIADVRDAGFENAAEHMQFELDKTPLNKIVIESPL